MSRTAGGNMIYIEHTTDFEFFSSTSAGAIQGYGYVFHTGKSSTKIYFEVVIADFYNFSWNLRVNITSWDSKESVLTSLDPAFSDFMKL